MKIAIPFAAIFALTSASMAQAASATPPCLTPAEFTALSSYALPSVIRGTSQRCASVLPGDAFLAREGERLADRYAQRKAANWPVAKAAFLKLGGTEGAGDAAEMFRTLPDSTLQPLVDGLIEGMINQKLPSERCAAVDRLIALLSPLPAENTAELIGLAAGFGAKSGQAKVGQFSICPA